MNNVKSIITLIKKLTLICVGAFLSAIVLNGLYLPNELLSGGIAGIAMLLNLTLSWDVALVTFLINVPIFVVGYFLMDKRYVVCSLIGMLALSASLKITENIPIISTNMLVVIALGGVLYGFAISLLALQHGSCGGNDIITRILHKYFSIPMGTSTLIINVSILGISIVFFGIDKSVMTMIANFIYCMSLNYFSEKRFNVKVFAVKTKKSENWIKSIDAQNVEIVEVVTNNFFLIYCTPKQVNEIRYKISKTDPEAIISISTVDSVQSNALFTDRLYKNTM